MSQPVVTALVRYVMMSGGHDRSRRSLDDRKAEDGAESRKKGIAVVPVGVVDRCVKKS